MCHIPSLILKQARKSVFKEITKKRIYTYNIYLEGGNSHISGSIQFNPLFKDQLYIIIRE